MVEGSQLGIDLIGYRHERSATGLFGNVVPPTLCEPAPGDHRFEFTAFFDPATGLYLGHNGWDAGHRAGVPESIWRLAEARARPVHPVTPTTTPSPLATRTPVSPNTLPVMATLTPRPTPTAPFAVDGTGVPLSSGEVPQAVVDTARVLPWVAGGRWAYRATRVEDMVHWSTFAETETVASAEQLSPATMEVRLDYGEPLLAPWADGMGLTGFLRPDGLYSDRWLVGQDLPAAVFRMPLGTPTRVDDFWHIFKVGSVTAPAGHFENCHVLVESAGARNLSAHWLCPGVGFVRHELPYCGEDGSTYTVYELVDYEIPPHSFRSHRRRWGSHREALESVSATDSRLAEPLASAVREGYHFAQTV